MNNHPGENNVQTGFLVLADISGYTKFMLANRETMVHGQLIINELIKAVLTEVNDTFRISKLEGDAVFMYLFPADEKKELSQVLPNKLFALPKSFETKRRFLAGANICHCNACKNIHELRIKVIAHFGQAMVSDIGDFSELSGVDVILVHRLLKNKVKSKEYILLTDPAFSQLVIGNKSDFKSHIESDDDLGEIKVHVLDLENGTGSEDKPKIGVFRKFTHELWKIGSTLGAMSGLKRLPKLNNLEE